jgi:hypothetical protein
MTTSRANTRSDARFFALIPCAGQGSRAGTAQAKQYQLIAGQPMVRHTVQAFRALSGTFAALWVVVSPSDEEFLRVFPDYNHENEHLLPGGGATRAATVLNGLKAMVAQAGGATLDDWVLVHDAARCLVTPEQIDPDRRLPSTTPWAACWRKSCRTRSKASERRPRGEHHRPQRQVAGADAADVPHRHADRGAGRRRGPCHRRVQRDGGHGPEAPAGGSSARTSRSPIRKTSPWRKLFSTGAASSA